ncbi:MAG: DinB family protein [Chitinophagaceae bacterium]
MNTRLFDNALAGISEEQGKERMSEHNNPINWIAAHTVHARYLMLIFLGKPTTNPYNDFFDNFKAYDATLAYPSLEEIKKEWTKVTALLSDALKSVTEEQLAADLPIKSPIGDFTNGGTLAFLTQHESYDLGQLGLLKKYFTREAMSYN